jgi:parallel beta-helix repeat protein
MSNIHVEDQRVKTVWTTTTYTPHDAISITSDEEFNSMAIDEGWSGDGTAENPYIITGFLLTDPTTQPFRIWHTRVHWIFRDNIVEGGVLCGIYIVNTTNGILENNIVRNRHNGMAFRNVVNLTITQNSIYNNSAHAMEFLEDSIGIVIENNQIEDNRYSGIQIPSVIGCEIIGNTIHSRADNGISIASGTDVVILNNSLDSNEGKGIVIGADYSIISQNTISNSGDHGIALTSGSFSEISNNTVQDSAGYGLYLSSPTSNNTIMENSFIRNGEGCQAFDSGLDNSIIFNYYSDWTTPDLDSNSIVDEPYLIDGTTDSSDSYPLVEPYIDISGISTTSQDTDTTIVVPLDVIVPVGTVLVVLVVVLILVLKKRV